MNRDHLVRTIEKQARDCAELGSPLYAELLDCLAQDVRQGGVAARVLAGHENDPARDLLALRLAGAVHRVVLTGRAPNLARFYPSAGGVPGSPRVMWAAFRDVLESHREDVRALLGQAPQTNEVGRSAALLGGLLHIGSRFGQPIRLVEIGASAGLNLRADHFRYVAHGRPVWGPTTSPIVLAPAWTGVLPPVHAPLAVIERIGYDVAPVDPSGEEGLVRLLSYVWPDQIERVDRLKAAVAVARRVPADLVRASALDAVEGLSLVPGCTTVVWHSVMWQYLTRAEQVAVGQRLADLGGQATDRARLAHLYLEPSRDQPRGGPRFVVGLQVWPGWPRSGGRLQVLGEAQPHGLPTTWQTAHI